MESRIILQIAYLDLHNLPKSKRNMKIWIKWNLGEELSAMVSYIIMALINLVDATDFCLPLCSKILLWVPTVYSNQIYMYLWVCPYSILVLISSWFQKEPSFPGLTLLFFSFVLQIFWTFDSFHKEFWAGPVWDQV